MILTIDLGTSATKVAVWDEGGLVAMGRAPLETLHPAPGQAEQDPRSWWPSIVAACPRVDGPLDAIAFSAARESLVPVTEAGEPQGNAVMWSDSRIPIGDRLLSPRDFVVWHMTGLFATDWTMASVSRITEQPNVLHSASVVGGLLPDRAADLGVAVDTPVVIGAGDRQCEVLGAGASAPQPMVSWGTTANVSVPVAPGKAAAGLRRTRAAIDGWLLEGGLSAAGSLLAWLGVSFADAAGSPPGARGVFVLPWLDGARAPWWRPDVGAAVVNLSSAHTRHDVARAAIEGVAWDVDRCLRRGAPGATGLAVAGGGAREPVWLDVLTGITGLPAQRRQHEAASAGAALLGACAVGAVVDLDRINPVVEEVEPTSAATYAALRDDAQAAAEAIIQR
ncbi:MAG: FGGY family carbohydrate kinase [Acidimicrobiales bacterium]